MRKYLKCSYYFNAYVSSVPVFKCVHMIISHDKNEFYEMVNSRIKDEDCPFIPMLHNLDLRDDDRKR